MVPAHRQPSEIMAPRTPWLALRKGHWDAVLFLPAAAEVGAPAGNRARDRWPSRPAADFSAGKDTPANWGFFKWALGQG